MGDVTSLAGSVPQPGQAVAPWLRALLRCPVTGQELLDVVLPGAGPCLLSPGARLAYPVRDGVPVLLVDQALPAPAGASQAGASRAGAA